MPFVEDAERKAAEHARNDEEHMRARQNEEELSKLDKLIAEAIRAPLGARAYP